MLEAMIIFFYVYAFRYWKLRGKSFEELTPSQKVTVEKALRKDRIHGTTYRSETYLPFLQKSAVVYMVIAIILSVAEFFLFFYIYLAY